MAVESLESEADTIKTVQQLEIPTYMEGGL